MHVEMIPNFCDPPSGRWTFKATVFRAGKCRGYVGFGDADPSNVSPLVHGAEMRVAETRAVNRALRKAYGIGICSVEEIGSFDRPSLSVRYANFHRNPRTAATAMEAAELGTAPGFATVSASSFVSTD